MSTVDSMSGADEWTRDEQVHPLWTNAKPTRCWFSLSPIIQAALQYSRSVLFSTAVTQLLGALLKLLHNSPLKQLQDSVMLFCEEFQMGLVR